MVRKAKDTIKTASLPAAVPHVLEPAQTTPSQFFATHPVFRIEELRSFYTRTRRDPESSADLVSFHVKKRHLVRVRNGVYVRDDFFDDALIASRLADDAVVGFGCALRIRGFAGTPSVAPFFTTRHVRPVTFKECIFKPVRVEPPSGVIDSESFIVHGLEVRATRLEQTFIDCFSRGTYAPDPIGLVTAFIRSAKTIDLDRLLHLAKGMTSPLGISRLGFSLQCTPLTLTPKQDASLLRGKLSQPDYFSRETRTSMDSLDIRWNLIVQPELLKLRVLR